MQRLVLIDSHSLIHRAYHALPKTFITADGKHTNAVYGYTRMLLKLVEDLRPDYLVATFDSPGPTFRTEMAESYKAHRPKPERDLVEQFAYVDEVVEALGIRSLKMGGYEADDLIATITTKLRLDLNIVVVTGDNDLMQLVEPNVQVYYPVKGISQSEMFDVAKVQAKFGLNPDQIADYKALRGDPSDNIPGVPGIGEKTAQELLRRYGTLEGVYQHLDEIGGKTQELLEGFRGQAKLSQELATLEKNVPVIVNVDEMKIEMESEKYRPVFEKYQFTSLLKSPQMSETQSDTDQLALF